MKSQGDTLDIFHTLLNTEQKGLRDVFDSFLSWKFSVPGINKDEI
jgi:hypothetical protein